MNETKESLRDRVRILKDGRITVEPLCERAEVLKTGRIMIPKKIMEQLGIRDGSVLVFYTLQNKAVIELLER
jgi:AbrB family looped-hinge helix DNA binding protein